MVTANLFDFDILFVLTTVLLYFILRWTFGACVRMIDEARLIVAILLLYNTLCLTSVNNVSMALDNANKVLRLEHIIGIDVEYQMQNAFHTFPSLMRWICFFDLAASWMSAMVFFAWLVLRRSRPIQHCEFLLYLRTFLLANLIAHLFFFVFPCAPPRMLNGFHDSIREFTGFSPYDTGANSFATMPSLLFGYSLLFAHGVARLGPPLLWPLALIYPLVMLVAGVVTGNHFLLSAVASAAVMFFAFSFVERHWPPQLEDCEADPDLSDEKLLLV